MVSREGGEGSEGGSGTVERRTLLGPDCPKSLFRPNIAPRSMLFFSAFAAFASFARDSFSQLAFATALNNASSSRKRSTGSPTTFEKEPSIRSTIKSPFSWMA